MGKISPSVRFLRSSMPLLKAPPSPFPSDPQSQLPKPRCPVLKPALGTKKKNTTKATAPAPLVPQFFQSPLLADAISTFASISTSTGHSLDHNFLVQSYCNTGASPADALAFLRHISSSFAPSRATYHILLGHACLHSSADPSPVLDLMAAEQFPPDPSSADLAVRALCSVERLDDACAVVRRLANASSSNGGSVVAVDQFTYNFLIRRLARSWSIPSVYKFMDELRRSLAKFQPDLVTYTILIEAVCRRKNLREATNLLGLLADSGFKPDCYLYNTIMKGYCMVDQFSEVMEVYNKMRDEGVEPDLVTYNTLVYGLSKAGMVDQAKKFLVVMANMGHFPDTVTYTSLMNGMCRKGDAMGALKLLKEMEDGGCVPNECTFNTLLMGLCKSKYLDKGMELYGVMTTGCMKLEKAAYATFIRALCRANKIAQAYEVFDYALESKSINEVTAYTALESSLKGLKKGKL